MLYFGFILYVIIGSPNKLQGIGFVIEILFAVIGFYNLFGRFLVKAVQKRRTLYALTDSRALVLVGANSTQSVPAP
ncbi:MAG: hypothetical protein V4479_06545 [Actinomycetota bacterium]